MKHPRLVFAAIVAAGALTAFTFARLWNSGPSYGAKSAAQWLKVYRTGSLAEREDARDAFKALGDQAVPYLFSVLTRPDCLSLARLYEKLRSKLTPPFTRLLPSVSTDETERRAARELLGAIRPSAKVLMPRLTPWLSSSEHPRYVLAIDLLCTVGDGRSEVVPFLVQALGSTNRHHRIFATQSLEYFGAEARAALPALIGALADPATHIRVIKALGNIGPEAKDAAPALERLLDSTDPREAMAAAAAFHKIRPEGNGLRLLIDAAGDPRLRMAAISELGELGRAAMPAVDALLEALKGDTGRDRVGGLQAITIADALRKVSPTNRTAISTLLDRLEETEAPERQNQAAGSMGMTAYGFLAANGKSDRLNIASRLVWLDPAEPHGLEVLVETLHSDPDPGTRAFAAYVLRQAGPGAREAIPALKAALNDKDKAVRRSAASALKKIELPGAK